MSAAAIKIMPIKGTGMSYTRRAHKWAITGDGPKKPDDLSFTSRDAEGRMVWWNVTPPKTNYWHVHEMLGRAYAFEVLDLLNTPDAECPERIVSYITLDMHRWSHTVPWCAAEGIMHGFFDALSEYLVTGSADR